MEKGQGNGTDTLQTDNVFTRKEYIEREAAKSAIMWCEDENNFDFSQGLIAAEDTLDNIPAADVVPVRHGRWEKATGMMPPEYCGLHICSECGHYAGRKPPYGGREMLSDYCPNCGARMDGD